MSAVRGAAVQRTGPVRCAIYTRKSSDEGLEQSFNSLDAQREACAAYILSQASEGWTALPDIYDDGGISGGTLERPALQRLLAEVAAARVDIIVVYKVDRLTRSLFDFAKLVETFDKAGTSFVSVTQSFNTTTSMGRLTLNMLLSFAQFEREVTAERIRDKIAASKARGMWMGGVPPLGYKPDGRSLAIVEDHAALVRHIFERYLALGNVRLLHDELLAARIHIPERTTTSGKTIGGGTFSRGLLHVMLRRVTYDGQIQHCDKVFVGNHPAIIDHDMFERVQAILAANIQGKRTGKRQPRFSLLAGRLIDEAGEPLIATHANKGNARYRYYVSRALHLGTSDKGSRIPALELEAAVCQRAAEAFGDPVALAATIGAALTPKSMAGLDAAANDTIERLGKRHRATVQALVGEVRMTANTIEIDCATIGIAEALGMAAAAEAPPMFTLIASVTLTRTGRAMRLVQDNGAALDSTPNAATIKLLLKARRWWRVIRAGELNVTELAAAEKVSPAYVTRVMRLAFLSPQITEAVLKGKLRANVDAASLTLGGSLPACWREQATALLPASPVS
ncbi:MULTISPECIES: recombinase family protein [unclassified Sphingomonas]|uniref:recombinase family protein n=1 Tax=unclassified Sphingomonas TaxID=196159 RepID=UPI002269C4B1|nr:MULTISPECIES: recombinase family protein [unclassified Sphingomonas]